MFSKLTRAGTLLSTTKTEEMKASTIQRYLSGRCRGQFMGVFSCDTLPRHVPKRPAIIVCNTDPSDRSGEHWICIYISGNRHGEFFDSFGRKPGSPFCEFLNRHCVHWTYNDKQLQNIFSSVCGAYCVFFAIYKSYGHDMQRIVCAFTNNTMINDCLVDRFVRKLK